MLNFEAMHNNEDFDFCELRYRSGKRLGRTLKSTYIGCHDPQKHDSRINIKTSSQCLGQKKCFGNKLKTRRNRNSKLWSCYKLRDA